MESPRLICPLPRRRDVRWNSNAVRRCIVRRIAITANLPIQLFNLFVRFIIEKMLHVMFIRILFFGALPSSMRSTLPKHDRFYIIWFRYKSWLTLQSSSARALSERRYSKIRTAKCFLPNRGNQCLTLTLLIIHKCTIQQTFHYSTFMAFTPDVISRAIAGQFSHNVMTWTTTDQQWHCC